VNSIDAAAKVLEDEGKPLHYREITKRIIDHGLWQTAGKTPEATLNANLGKDMKKFGAGSRFVRTGRGMFALREWKLPAASVPPPEKKSPPAPSQKPTTKTLSFTDAAERVLQKYSNKQPMHYRVITEKILELGLVNTQGKTPEATLYAQMLKEINKNTKRGEPNRFVRHGKGMVGLRKWMGVGLAYQIKRHNDEVRKNLLKQLHQMPPDEFEVLVAQLLIAIGFEDVGVTKYGSDGGIDVRGVLVVGDVIRTKMAVQVKRWKNNVQAPIVQQVRGSLGSHEQGLIITTSDFSKGARVESERPDATPVSLMNGHQLIQLLIENDIGIHRISYDLIDLGDAELD